MNFTKAEIDDLQATRKELPVYKIDISATKKLNKDRINGSQNNSSVNTDGEVDSQNKINQKVKSGILGLFKKGSNSASRNHMQSPSPSASSRQSPKGESGQQEKVSSDESAPKAPINRY